MERKIVYKIEDGMNPADVYCTTYQMRNFYKQMADGFFSSLDVMNYIQHHFCVLRMKQGYRVLDVCCGRGLLLPMIRWYRKDIAEYVGVDISESNLGEQKRFSGCKKLSDDTTSKEHYKNYYPFKITHLNCSVETMDEHLDAASFNTIVYTSAIEHMQKDVGFKSLENCYKLLKSNGEMIISTPNTIEKKNPYDTQYAAHLYEWDLEELSQALESIGFTIHKIFGLVGKVRDFEAFINRLDEETRRRYYALKEYLPSEWLMSFFPILYPKAAAEVLLVCGKGESKFKRTMPSKIKQLV